MNIDAILKATTANTVDSLTKKTLQDMNIDIDWKVSGLTVDMLLTAHYPINWLQSSFILPITQILQKTLPEYSFNFTTQHQVIHHKTQLPGKSLRGVKNVIAVGAGKGGVGKSTVAVNLAVSMAKAGARVGLLDADIYGPSIPTLLGNHQKPEVVENRYIPVDAHNISAMSIGYLTEEQALIWRGPMLAKSLLHMLDSTNWDNLDYLIIDLPPGTGDIHLSLAQKIPMSGAIIVTTPQTVSTMDAQKALAMFTRTGVPVLGVIENMALHTCSQCGHTESIFGKDGAAMLCSKNQTPLLGQLPLMHEICTLSDQGLPPACSNITKLEQYFLTIAIKAMQQLSQSGKNS